MIDINKQRRETHARRKANVKSKSLAKQGIPYLIKKAKRLAFRQKYPFDRMPEELR